MNVWAVRKQEWPCPPINRLHAPQGGGTARLRPPLLRVALLAWLGASLLSPAARADAAGDSAPDAASHQISGELRVDYYHTRPEYDPARHLAGGSSEIKLDSVWDPAWRSKIALRWQASDLGRVESGPEAREAYLLWHGARLDVKLGKQIVAWGRADGINPTDNLTPRNYAILLPYEADQRTGSVALSASYFPALDQTLSWFLAPGLAPDKLPLPVAAGLRIDDQQPGHNRWPLGVKWDQRGERLDWSVSYYRGYQLLPELAATADAQTLALRYPKIQVLGADAAFNLGPYGLRGELARTLRSDAGVLHGNWMFVGGIDRNFDDDLNLNLQWIWHHADQPVSSSDPIDQLNAISFNQTRRQTSGATFRIGKKWFNGTLEAELLTFHYFQPHSSYWRPLVAYALADHVKLTLGTEWYGGPADSYFGQNRRLRKWFGELRYSF